MLPKTQQRLEEQQVAAMGDHKWMSKASQRKGVNLRSPKTARKQAGNDVLQVHWTPVFARGEICLYVCDREAAANDARLPAKLNDSENLAKFVKHVLPGLLNNMKAKHGWPNIPRVVVHDKASYMVTPHHNRLQHVFASALDDAGFRNWVGHGDACCDWLAPKWGDVYLHETAIAHVRRLLDEEFPCAHVHETVAQFRNRMGKVEDAMNSEGFGKDGAGLMRLARQLRSRCEQVIACNGERLPK